MITYKDAEKKFDSIQGPIEGMLEELRKNLLKGKKDKGIPIYLADYRLKTIDSIYLKTKRKRKATTLEDIEDYGGLRVLCLFDQDIQPVFYFLIQELFDRGFYLREMEVYNWNDKKQYKQFESRVQEIFKARLYRDKTKPECNLKQKGSGYKSIHLIVYKNDLPVEIQLRTLLQNVWGELEHELSYKQGNIHPHIKKSFSLLAKDLEANDELMAHLRDISDKEKYASEFASTDKGPCAIFSYEEDLKCNQLSTDNVKPLLKEYDDYVKEHWEADAKDWTPKARLLLKQVLRIKDGAESQESEVQYWINMEEAFLLFAEKQHDEALRIYQKVVDDGSFSDRYVPHFRIGEIQFIKFKLKDSLLEFDKCEEKMGASVNSVNAFAVMSRLANIYWMIGEEYIDIAWNKISEAENLYHRFKGELSDKEASLINNMAWYSLERYILSQREYGELSRIYGEDDKILITKREEVSGFYDEAKIRYNKLEKFLDSNTNSTANSFDTGAWFCYHAWLREESSEFLKKAENYCRESWRKKSFAIHDIHSSNIRRVHTQEIIGATKNQQMAPI